MIAIVIKSIKNMFWTYHRYLNFKTTYKDKLLLLLLYKMCSDNNHELSQTKLGNVLREYLYNIG